MKSIIVVVHALLDKVCVVVCTHVSYINLKGATRVPIAVV